MKSIYKITLLFLLFPLIAIANNDKKKHEKDRVIKKEFTVNSDARVSLNNRYGNLNITTWDKNRVEIEVTITVKGDDLDAVEDKLSSIHIAFNSSSSSVEAETIFGDKKNNWSWWKRSKNINYRINYVVKMPKTNSVDLDNDYGNIYLDKLFGKADINCDYGKISVGELLATNNNINLDYCSTSTINYMNSGDVNIDYSKLNIDNSKDLRVNADYSTLKLGKAGTIDFNCDYGSVSVNDADDININSDYTSMRFGTIRKNLNIDTEYGSVTVKELAKNFENVVINGEYAGIRIGVEPGAVFNFELDLQYAGFKRDNDKMEFFKSISKSTKKYYEGKYGKGNSSSRLKIKSQYGGVSITENN
ncbi:hypothetical protein H9W90_07390 [Polaribacter pectinis]|uniref:Adhesin domain-containing protein n=1 Tax=Polaribacter pectinis TaxID=2738844 RepID=A0A7G9LE75_9FLAO|nr:hypothetical protein [Polaribacter pectinis]QNM86924.1 hypothetical protein H9W90_07390 [Polaribacter pectinis]